MKGTMILATLAATVAGMAATALPAQAAVGSATLVGHTATLTLDGADDNVTVSVSGGLLVHGQTTGGLSSGSDWDSAKAGNQTVPADGTFTVVVNGGDGNDAITVLAKNTEIAATTLNGGGGDDVLTGADTNDTLNGGEGNDALSGGGGDDRIVGDRGADSMNGGSGDDTLVWNNGDGSDVINGDGGSDDVEVNGSPTAGDAFTVQPNGARIKFDRTNLVPFSLDIGSSETMHANGLGGDDTIAVGNVGDRLGRLGQRHAQRRQLVRDVPRRVRQRHHHARRRHRHRLRRRWRRPDQHPRQDR